MADTRDLDIVVFGATGFTGELTAAYLAEHAPAGCRWALAGRNTAKLEAVRKRLAAINPACADLELLHADSGDPASLVAVAARTKVVITTVGPYLQHGDPLVAACAAAGTDYVDLTGEPEFVDLAYLAHHETAVASGARIVHACGFDSIPHDLGAYFTMKQLPAGEKASIRGVVRSGAQFSGGTFHSALGAMSRQGAAKKALRARRKKEGRPADRKVHWEQGMPGRDSDLGYYLLPMPTIDPLIVTRSANVLDLYGPDFTYSHFAGLKTLRYTVGAAVGVGTLVAAANVGPVREALKKRIKQGEGPSEARRAKSWFTVDFVGEAGGTKVHTRVSGGDPGYTETAKMLAESALCLAYDDNPPTAGQVTTAAAMGENLLARLQLAGITFEVV
ncbi:saccharopine dehydrogenase family protein [Nocardioides marmorisolisilvae]|uniref:Saccharopine dehydrogenase n=1 Tax=Nocardioides marmorisolisilvae TaxID=1542737 RepID=A0A3N0DRX9_9ACTN|nr:saccharopine dehydrogenase NADP-binding domain-containing protein [Nocardioides marmorisolisilvae]RNL78271.1 saccharopine dehydrogenase [Nocardioides marmorisolisilvae]